LHSAGTPAPGADRWLAPEIDIAVELITTGAVVAAAESVSGPLN
jgi:histidine ammonia-lyase